MTARQPGPVTPAGSGLPDYGLVPPAPRRLEPGEVTCPAPEAATLVEVRADAPGSPIATIAVPDGFTADRLSGIGSLTLSGPNGMVGDITMAPTGPDARAVFADYLNQRAAVPINTVSVQPGQLCGYSGQMLSGFLADEPGRGADFADRIVHVPTVDAAFLVAIRLEAPPGTAGFAAARSVLLADFGIRMPG